MAAATLTTLTSRERMMRAFAGLPVDRPPVWMMRQAGRYLPEYRALRAKHDFLSMCRRPDLAAEVSLQPLERLGVDAVIVFNDILIPLESMGIPVQFTERGPQLDKPLRDRASLENFTPATFDHEAPVAATLRRLRAALGADTALLGFAGAPFTMACYAWEGRLSRDLAGIKHLLRTNPARLHQILERITDTVTEYLRVQIEAGADAVQLFETWGGALTCDEYRAFALPYQREIIHRLDPLGTPITLYAKAASHLLELLPECGADALSVDWTLSLSAVRRRVGNAVTLQGNLDPRILTTHPEIVSAATRRMLEAFRDDGRHIANLGHGILPTTPIACAEAFIQTVKELRP